MAAEEAIELVGLVSLGHRSLAVKYRVRPCRLIFFRNSFYMLKVVNETFYNHSAEEPLSGADLANRLLNRTLNLRIGWVHMMALAQLSHHNLAKSFDYGTGSFQVWEDILETLRKSDKNQNDIACSEKAS